MSDEELSRDVATQTRLARHGWCNNLQACMDECQRRKRMDIFHDAQIREFERPLLKERICREY
jgi:hypothetical protein